MILSTISTTFSSDSTGRYSNLEWKFSPPVQIFGQGRLPLGAVAPLTAQWAALQKNRGANAVAVVDGKAFEFKKSGLLLHVLLH